MSHSQPTIERVLNDFAYHKPDANAVDKMRQIRAISKHVAKMIVELVPAGREQASALTRLEEAMMHANAGIARRFPVSN